MSPELWRSQHGACCCCISTTTWLPDLTQSTRQCQCHLCSPWLLEEDGDVVLVTNRDMECPLLQYYRDQCGTVKPFISLTIGPQALQLAEHPLACALVVVVKCLALYRGMNAVLAVTALICEPLALVGVVCTTKTTLPPQPVATEVVDKPVVLCHCGVSSSLCPLRHCCPTSHEDVLRFIGCKLLRRWSISSMLGEFSCAGIGRKGVGGTLGWDRAGTGAGCERLRVVGHCEDSEGGGRREDRL